MMTKLNLEKSICFFDLETTGIELATARIVEIAILKITPDGNKEMYVKRIHPGIPIPPQTSAIHGIYDQDVANEKKFAELAHEIKAFIGDSDLAGFNSNKFDVPVLVEEFLRAEVDFEMNGRNFVDVQTIFHKMEQRTLSAAYQFYCNKPLENAHSAEADILATYEILEAQLQRYSDLKNDICFLSEFTKGKNIFVDFAGRIVYNEQNLPCFNFGKHKGKPVEEVLRTEPSYYAWMMNGDFPLHTKKVMTEIKEKMNKIKG